MYRYLMNHPLLTKRVSHLGEYLRFEGTLPGIIREFIILYISRKLNIAYEWTHLIKPAKGVGLSLDIIKKIKTRKIKALKSPYNQLIRAINLILNLKSIPKTLQKYLINIFEVKGLIEIVILCGFYRMIAGVITSFDVPLAKGIKKPW